MVLKISINCVKLVGKGLISPPSTLLIAGDKAITNASLVKTKVKEYHHHMHGKDMLGRVTLMLQCKRLGGSADHFADELVCHLICWSHSPCAVRGGRRRKPFRALCRVSQVWDVWPSYPRHSPWFSLTGQMEVAAGQLPGARIRGHRMLRGAKTTSPTFFDFDGIRSHSDDLT